MCFKFRLPTLKFPFSNHCFFSFVWWKSAVVVVDHMQICMPLCLCFDMYCSVILAQPMDVVLVLQEIVG